MTRLKRFFAALALPLLLALAACAPAIVDPGPATETSELHRSHFWTRDGISLAYRSWLPGETPKAVIVALHGFNDYSPFFDTPATFLKDHGIASYAYDQRGFGANGFRGRWFPTARYTMDARDFTRRVHERHPGVPLYVLGESMGGAVAMTLAARHDTPWIAGWILSAPAVWARDTMPWYQRATLWLAAHTMPAVPLTGRGLKIKPSDNIEMLIQLGRDPLVIKGTRIDAIYGLVDLMDTAMASAAKLDGRTLILYGGRDEIITSGPTATMLDRLPDADAATRRIAVYPGGYHMLLRDLEAEIVWRDIAAWLDNPAAALPSGAETGARALLDGRP
ncbi:MAG: lysophospholipase [Rhodospirillales bacterium]|nr:lysophospholipase [Rhodospirillales bacterium]MBO6788504.1 lysophospholipase [Rhodospirillales bacterium]